MSNDLERIWLEPAGERTELRGERTWCQDKVWPNDEEPGEPTEYVRADILNTVSSVLAKTSLELQQLSTVAAKRLARISELHYTLQSLVNDITSMKTNPPKDSEAAYWFGPFSEFDNNIESADIEWPNLAITCEEAEKLLKEIKP